MVDKLTTSLPDIVTSAGYPSSCTNPRTCNQPETSTDANGNITTYAYDPGHGGLTSITFPAPTPSPVQPQIRYGYTSLFAWYKNAAGNIVQGPSPITKLTGSSQCQTLANCAGLADEVKTTLTRGTTGVANNLQVTSASTGAGDGSLTATSSFAYNAVGNLALSDGPLPGKVDRIDYSYDPDLPWRLTDVIHDPDGSGPINPLTTTYAYDPDNRVTQIRTIGRGGSPQTNAVQTSFTYDELGRVTKRRSSSGAFAGQTHAVTHYTYDEKGRLQCVNVRMNPADFNTVAASCTLGTAGSFGPDRITRLEYSNADEVTRQTVAYLTPDAADEVRLTYTGNGLLQTLKDAENNLTTYEYDGHDRLQKTRFPVTAQGANQSSTTDFEELGYDPNGNVTSRIPRGGSAGYQFGYVYDALDRLTALGPPNPEPTKLYSYDNLGRVLSASTTAGQTASFTYDALGRNLTQAGPQGTVTSQWDIGGRRARLTYPDNFFLDYDYNGVGSLWRIRENGAVSGPGVLATYEYDNFDRRNLLLRGNGRRTTYEYDGAQRLSVLVNTSFGSPADVRSDFSYNPASQIVGVTRTNDSYAWTGHFNTNVTGAANGLNQLTQVGPKSLSHDARGNVTAFGTKSFTYYPSNGLWTVASPWSALVYDPLGRLAVIDSASDTIFGYDGLDRILEFDGSSAIQRRYVHGPGMDEPLAWYEGSGTANRRFLEADERGSVIAVADSAGAVLNINKYDEYGQPQGTNLGNFGYTGQAWLPGIGEWYYKARNQDAELGRFLQTDPIGYGGGINLYAYVGNDPVNWVDPLGLDDDDIVVKGRRRRCPAGWVCVQPGVTWRPYPGTDGGEITVTGSRSKKSKRRRLPRTDIATLAWCGLSSLLGNRWRFRIGADAAGGYGIFIRGGAGISVRGDGSLEFDAYGGGGVGGGYTAGYGIGLDNQGTPHRGGARTISREVCISGGVQIAGGSACLPNEGRVGDPNIDYESPQFSGGGSVGPKYGLAVGSTKSVNLTYRTSSPCL